MTTLIRHQIINTFFSTIYYYFLFLFIFFFFFFSSRRRHTRLQVDWSSDVCSSDLAGLEQAADAQALEDIGHGRRAALDSEQVHRLGWHGAACHLAHDVLAHDLLAHGEHARRHGDRKSTRLNSSHLVISYAVFCLKKKKKK